MATGSTFLFPFLYISGSIHFFIDGWCGWCLGFSPLFGVCWRLLGIYVVGREVGRVELWRGYWEHWDLPWVRWAFLWCGIMEGRGGV
jgi:hypothetical protein